MKTIIDKKEERVCYIEYNDDGTPHQVYTAIFSEKCVSDPTWILMHWWDFFANGGDKDDIRHYNAGGGGSAAEIDGPHWVSTSPGRYWIDDSIVKFRKQPINGIRLLKPLRIKTKWKGSSINPFNVSEETYSSEYCEICGFESTEMCDLHQYEDNEGNLRYIHPHHH